MSLPTRPIVPAPDAPICEPYLGCDYPAVLHSQQCICGAPWRPHDHRPGYTYVFQAGEHAHGEWFHLAGDLDHLIKAVVLAHVVQA
jgi:hypothetical protein